MLFPKEKYRISYQLDNSNYHSYTAIFLPHSQMYAYCVGLLYYEKLEDAKTSYKNLVEKRSEMEDELIQSHSYKPKTKVSVVREEDDFIEHSDKSSKKSSKKSEEESDDEQITLTTTDKINSKRKHTLSQVEEESNKESSHSNISPKKINDDMDEEHKSISKIQSDFAEFDKLMGESRFGTKHRPTQRQKQKDDSHMSIPQLNKKYSKTVSC